MSELHGRNNLLSLQLDKANRLLGISQSKEESAKQGEYLRERERVNRTFLHLIMLLFCIMRTQSLPRDGPAKVPYARPGVSQTCHRHSGTLEFLTSISMLIPMPLTFASKYRLAKGGQRGSLRASQRWTGTGGRWVRADP